MTSKQRIQASATQHFDVIKPRYYKNYVRRMDPDTFESAPLISLFYFSGLTAGKYLNLAGRSLIWL